MLRSATEEITLADIKILVASIYEPLERRWLEGRWICPHCVKRNAAETRSCACGITRDGLPEFCETSVVAGRIGN